MPQVLANSYSEIAKNLLPIEPNSQSNAFDIHYYVGLILRYRWVIIIPFWIAMIAGIFLAVMLPRKYQAETLIFVESQQVPENYVQSIVSGDHNKRINSIIQMVKSRINLTNIIEQFQLFNEPESDNMFLEDKLKVMRKRTSVDLISEGNNRMPSSMFSISYIGEDPEEVMRVVNAMANLVIDQNIQVRKSKAEGTTNFLNDELAKMRKRLEEVELALKEYRKNYMGELPEQLEGNIAILDRLQRQLIEKQQELRDEKNRLIFIENQLQFNRQLADRAEAALPDGAEQTIIEELKMQMKELQTRYTDKHPDVIELKKKIKHIEGENIQRKMEQINTIPSDIGNRTDIGPRTTTRTHISFSDGSSRMLESWEVNLPELRNTIEVEIETTKDEILKLQKQITFYHQRVENTPKREQEVLTLKRDYENIKETYNSLLARKLEADIAVNMEKRQQGEQFRILDPARLPNKPVSPKMQKLFLLCVVSGLFFGGGIIFLLEFFDDAVRKPESVKARLGIPVLIALPSLERRKDFILRLINNASSILGVMIALFLFACFVAVTILNMHQPVELIKKYITI
jgi:polysaccharide chain length determinant protein (PEP-CTERM system associated)